VKHLVLWIIVLAPFSERILLAQDITGTWQGTLKAATEMRFVVKISKTQDGGFKGVVYNIDRGGFGVQSSSISLQGSALEMSVPGMGGAYSGTLNSEGTLITGTWTQGQPFSLDLSRPTGDTPWTKFDVASIRPNNSGARPLPSQPCLPGGRWTVTNVTLVQLIVSIYSSSVRRIQMQGGPDWIDSERFDIVATPDTSKGEVKPGQCNLMIQTLLEDRFKLRFHTETKEMSAYVLVVGKNPPKLQQPKEGEQTTVVPGPLGQMNFQRMSMQGLVNTVSNIVQIPVMDATGITGLFDFTLDPAQFATTGSVQTRLDYGDYVVTAVQEELGFKLEKRKMPLEITVIDNAERPTDN
jgi:uncharacterized protein (TIGR03435 family)